MDPRPALRPITEKDREFLYRVYASTREEELAQTSWDEAQKKAFLQMQFDAQHTYYQDQFSGADFQIVLLDGEPIGRLYVDRREDEIRVIDLALLAEYRNKGLGSRLLEEILAEARMADLPVRFHVERYNPALRLFQRLGFRRIADRGVYYLLEWTASSQTSQE